MTYHHLTKLERYQIYAFRKAQYSVRQTAMEIGRAPSTISRELLRSSKAEEDQRVSNVEAFRDTHAEEANPRLKELQKVARERKSTFAALMEAGRVCLLGSMSHALYDVGGEYRRNM